MENMCIPSFQFPLDLGLSHTFTVIQAEVSGKVPVKYHFYRTTAGPSPLKTQLFSLKGQQTLFIQGISISWGSPLETMSMLLLVAPSGFTPLGICLSIKGQ